MAKVKSIFFCSNCGNESPKWLGKCPSCGEWNSFQEQKVVKSKSGTISNLDETKTKPQNLKEIEAENNRRIVTPIPELNRVLGGGIVPGSVMLLGGEPGIGKSTLSLQLALFLEGKKVVYVSGEESASQIKLRAERLGNERSECIIYTETNIQKITKELESIEPDLVIVDSIQTLHHTHIESTPGSIVQIRESTGELIKYAKTYSVPVIVIGHITKDGAIAGPKVLEHMVDTVLQFEGDRNHVFRILRTSKNRFGSTNELGIFEMQMKGLVEVENPSDILISQRNDQLSGIAIAASMEGMRPLLIEVQALVSSAVYGTPQRSSTGFDLRRLSMLLAVLEKRCGFRLGMKDVFLNMAGGIRVDDPAIDLAVVCAVLSSNEDIAIDSKICFAAEVGLSGEIRSVSRADQRIKEAEKMGFEKIFISEYALSSLNLDDFKIEIFPAAKIEQVFRELFA